LKFTMVRECIVPFCTSKQGGNVLKNSQTTPGKKRLSFHELPYKLEIREEWLKNISRGDSKSKTKCGLQQTTSKFVIYILINSLRPFGSSC
jgi:THAP domain